MPGPRDPFGEVAALAGVGVAAAHARDAIDALLRHPVLREYPAIVAAESAARGARASAHMSGSEPDDLGDPTLQGALRATGAAVALAERWMRAPAQVLARLHVLAARDVTAAAALGRPRPDIDRSRFEQLLRLAGTSSAAPGAVVASIVHGELAVLRPFGSADDVTARATQRVVLVASGVDHRMVSVPEAGHVALSRAYQPLLDAYRSGTPAGVAAWVVHCCEAYARGAEEGLAICASIA